MTRSQSLCGLVLAALLLSCLPGCGGGLRLRPPTPLRSVVFAGFETVYSPEMPGNRRGVLDRMGVPVQMSAVLRAAYPVGPGPTVRIIITQFRVGRWGPARFHAVVHVLGPNGAPVAETSCDVTGVMASSRGAMVEQMSQQCVDQIAQRL